MAKEKFVIRPGVRALVKPLARDGKPVPLIPWPPHQPAGKPRRYMAKDRWTRVILDRYLLEIWRARNLAIEDPDRDDLVGEPAKAAPEVKGKGLAVVKDDPKGGSK